MTPPAKLPILSVHNRSHAAQIFDGLNSPNDDAVLCKRPCSAGEDNADDGGQKLRRYFDGERGAGGIAVTSITITTIG
jgi:hypothetical protein